MNKLSPTIHRNQWMLTSNSGGQEIGMWFSKMWLYLPVLWPLFFLILVFEHKAWNTPFTKPFSNCEWNIEWRKRWIASSVFLCLRHSQLSERTFGRPNSSITGVHLNKIPASLCYICLIHCLILCRKGKCNLQQWNRVTRSAEWETYSSEPCEFRLPLLQEPLLIAIVLQQLETMQQSKL